jgi:glycosyltransferase involved in cell wall biosynthesis
MPRICVVTPAFNERIAIAKAIGSIRAQTFQDWEMRVIDDGSVDGTYEAALAAADGDARVHVMRNLVNRGTSASKNIGWRATNAEYVAILDSDDVAEPERLALTADFLDRNRDICVVGGGARFVDEEGRFIRTMLMPETHEALAASRWHRAPFIHSTVLMRRSFLERTGGYPEDIRLGEDYDLWMRGFCMPGVRYANLGVPLVTYQTYHVQQWRMGFVPLQKDSSNRPEFLPCSIG